jgi:hypothetical protein
VVEGREFTEWSGQPPPHEEAEEVPNAWDIEAIAESLKAEPIDEVYTPWPNLTEAVLFDVGNDQKTHLTLAPHRASEFKRIRAHVHVEDVSLEFEPTGPSVTGKQEVMFLSDTESRRAVGEELEQSGSSPCQCAAEFIEWIGTNLSPLLEDDPSITEINQGYLHLLHNFMTRRRAYELANVPRCNRCGDPLYFRVSRETGQCVRCRSKRS